MSSVQRTDVGITESPAPEWSQQRRPSADCWQEIASLNAAGGHAAWASLASRRPAVEDRVSRLVDAIEHDIIPRLVRAHAQSPQPAAPGIKPGPAEVASFTAHVLARDDDAIQAQLGALRASGVSVESIYVDLLAPAARHFGTLWDDDRCHFADVTVGLGRLQQIMRSLSAAFGTDIDPPAGGRRALLMPAPGEQHTFGLSMVAEFFARAGWEVIGVMDPMSTHLEDKVSSEWFDLVGISAGTTTRLDELRDCIAAVRRHSHNRAVVVMVGGPLFVVHPELIEAIGADGVVTDGQQAPQWAERWLGRRAQGL